MVTLLGWRAWSRVSKTGAHLKHDHVQNTSTRFRAKLVSASVAADPVNRLGLQVGISINTARASGTVLIRASRSSQPSNAKPEHAALELKMVDDRMMHKKGTTFVLLQHVRGTRAWAPRVAACRHHADLPPSCTAHKAIKGPPERTHIDAYSRSDCSNAVHAAVPPLHKKPHLQSTRPTKTHTCRAATPRDWNAIPMPPTSLHTPMVSRLQRVTCESLRARGNRSLPGYATDLLTPFPPPHTSINTAQSTHRDKLHRNTNAGHLDCPLLLRHLACHPATSADQTTNFAQRSP
eukprot:1161174-Pelagomonas_calceolata.AAC.5